MAKNENPTKVFLQWTKHIQAQEVQDPLSLNLRVSARLGGQLLHCITSITPRARYYSFLPWCVYDYAKREKGKPNDRKLLSAIRRRENALTVGCVLSHDGKPCERGGLVGSDKVVAQYEGLKTATIDLGTLELVRNPAFNAYYASLVNLGVFKWTKEAPKDEHDTEAEEPPRTVDDLELAELGISLAEDYASAIGSLAAVDVFASDSPVTSAVALSDFGKRGGLCELATTDARDRGLLRAMFFNTDRVRKESHRFRRSSLLLLLELARQLEESATKLSVVAFAAAVHHNAYLMNDGTLLQFDWPVQLVDVVHRWRMFYCHYYLSVALESLLVCVLSTLNYAGLGGILLTEVADRMIGPNASGDLSQLLGATLPNSFMDATPQSMLAAIGADASNAAALDAMVDVQSPCAEWRFEKHLRNRDVMPSGAGAALALLLLGVVTARHRRLRDTDYGKWLANCVADPYLDLCPPVILYELEQEFPDWWTTPWSKLAPFLITQFVIRQHEALAYEKGCGGGKALLQIDGERVREQGNFDRIGVGNPRFGNAVSVLTDLGLLVENKDTECTVLTDEGRMFLANELKREVAP